jgi:GAF domain-containing protein
MSPSILFLINLSVSFISGIVALALLLLVLGVGLRQRLNQTFALFITFAATTSLSSSIAGVTLWLDVGAPLFWTELFAAGFYFVGPALAAFALVYVGSTARQYKLVILIGFLVGLALMPALFNHQIVSQARFGGNDLYNVEVTQLGYTAAVGSLLFQVLALVTFWRFRAQLGSSAPAISTAILVVGALYDFILRVPFPPLSFTFATGILIMGHDVMRRQIFNPLRTLTEQLEAQVIQRTQELQQARDTLESHNEQHHHIAQISHAIAQISDPTMMLAQLTELIHKQLGYHHVYGYQPDETNRYLAVHAVAGTTARMVMASGQRLPIGGRSLAGQVAAERQARIAEAQGDDAIYFGDTALPSARAEMALPLLVGDRLLGVLDFQSIHFDAFSAEDLVMMTTLTDQVAVILDNARLLQRTESALAELEKTQRQYLRQAWRSTISEPENAPAYVYSDTGGVAAASLSAAWSPALSQALTDPAPGATRPLAPRAPWHRPPGQVRASEPARGEEPDGGERSEVLALPITVRGEVIGALEVRHKPGRTWQREDLNILSEISARLGLALETARLSQENQRRAARERLIREITGDMRETMNIRTILERTIQRLGQEIGAEEVAVRIDPEGSHARSTGSGPRVGPLALTSPGERRQGAGSARGRVSTSHRESTPLDQPDQAPER